MQLWRRSTTNSCCVRRCFYSLRQQRQETFPTKRVIVRACLASLFATATTTRHGSTATAHGMRMAAASSSRAVPYDPPPWAQGSFTELPVHGRLHLGNFPTPLHTLFPTSTVVVAESSSVFGTQHNFYVKRDDSSGGVELGGNKVRKLEFLLADALHAGADSVVTIGGQQSNHCRATAAACRMVGLEPHLILRRSVIKSNTNNNGDEEDDEDLGLVGNLLVDRILQSRIYTCTTGEYGRLGSVELIQRLARHLQSSQGKKPYCIPVGGSNGLGSWGYIEGVQELLEQWKAIHKNDETSIDHIVFACGSGGTAAGIALGMALAYADKPDKRPVVHAIGVCDNPDYFYKFIAGIAEEMGFVVPSSSGCESTEDFLRAHLVVHHGKGLGYAVSTPEELDFVQRFAVSTGIVLDPVYSGKALYNFMKYLEKTSSSTPDDHKKQNVLFWHTGGGLGLYDKVPALEETLRAKAPCQRLDVYGKGKGLDLSEPTGDASS